MGDEHREIGVAREGSPRMAAARQASATRAQRAKPKLEDDAGERQLVATPGFGQFRRRIERSECQPWAAREKLTAH